MTTQIQRRRGTTAQHSTFTGAVGEVTVDTDKEVLVVHDGAQVGGYPQMRENGSNSALALGSAGTPSLKFAGDENTGIYSPGADQVALSTNGVGRVFVDALGATKLQVDQQGAYPDTLLLRNQATNIGAGFNDTGNKISFLGNNASQRVAGIDGYRTTNNHGTLGIHAFANTGNAAASILFGTSAGPTTDYNGYIVFGTGNNTSTERLRITSAGNVGIGTTSPAHQLVVGQNAWIGTGGGASTGVGTARTLTIGVNRTTTDVSPSIQLLKAHTSSTSVAGGFKIDLANASTNLPELAFYAGTSTGNSSASFVEPTWSERLRIDSSGRLLIGTATSRGNFFNNASGLNPGFQLEGSAFTNRVASITSCSSANNEDAAGLILARQNSGSVGGNTIVSNNNSLALLSFQGSDGSELVEAARIEAFVDGTPGANDMPGRIVLSTTADGESSPTERMRIGSNGTISTNQALSTTTVFSIKNSSNTGSQTVLEIQGGTYTTSDTTSKLIAFKRNDGTEIGSVIRNGTTTVNYATSSDYRLKENIEPLSNALAKVNSLKPSRFNFIGDTRTVDGFIAHEVQSIVPEAVTGEKDAVDDDGKPVYQGIDQSKLVPLLTAALQEAIGEIESLKARVAALESA